MTKEDFIEKATIIHNGKYDYSKVDYLDSKTKVSIICEKHGEFLQTPNHHLNGCGCPKCAGRKYTANDFIEEANKIHNFKYDYSKMIYVNKTTKVCIVCPEHGEFWQTPHKHINSQHGCPKCNSGGKNKQEVFIKKAKQIHGEYYDYSKVEYVNATTKVCIVCPEHGEFWQTPSKHLIGRGCKLCGESKRHIDLSEFVKRSNKIHNNYYDYSLSKEVKYVNYKTCIICPEHGEFYQTYESHMNGHGCPLCKQSKLEKEIERILIKNNIKYEREKCFNWLTLISKQRIDFYLPKYKIGIECQGIQHYKPIEYWGGEKGFQKQKDADINKKKLCEAHNVKLIYYRYNEDIYNFEEKIVNIINEASDTQKN